MKKLVLVCCCFLVTGYIFSQTNTLPSKEKVEQAAQLLGVSSADLQKWVDSKFVIAPTGTPIITAVELYRAYESSQPRADRTYKGKQVQVTGTVTKIKEAYDTNYHKRYCIKFQSGDSSYYDYIEVFFDEADLDPVFNVNVGQKITVLATVIQKDSVMLVLDHAKII
jgi:DNA-binding transcriptional regulator YdaS (Cro superfamily)